MQYILSKHTKMDVIMKVCLWMEKSKAEDVWHSKMAHIMKDNSHKIRWMEEELYIIPRIVQHMKEIGLMTDFMDLEHSITKVLIFYNKDLISETSISLMSIG